MRILRAILPGLMLTVMAVGCRSKAPDTSVRPDPNTPVPIEIESHFMGDVVIYLARGSDRQRLGMVTALSKAEFSVPWRRLSGSSNYRLIAYPIAGAAAHASDPLLLRPGQGIKWTLESDLGRSSMAVW